MADDSPAPNKASDRREGLVKRSIRIDQEIYLRVADIAKRRRSHVQTLVEQALLQILVMDTTKTTDADLAPIIDRVIQERHRKLEAGLRTIIAITGYEVLRTQYVLNNFLTEAGISPGLVDKWHEQGYQFAIKEFKRRQRADVFDEE